MTNPYLVEMWAKAICCVLGDVLLLASIVGLLAFIWCGVKHWWNED